MQIRVANRQDEPAIRAIVSEAKVQAGQAEVNLTGADADLSNVDANYFWYDGIFLVAEDDGKIVGLVGAKRGKSEQILELLRLTVSLPYRKQGIARSLLESVLYFAGNFDYEQVIMHPSRQHLDAAKPFAPFARDPRNADIWIAEVKSQDVRNIC
jgi:N-acetylglutamate synthase-like GNAT family acetyltransferase